MVLLPLSTQEYNEMFVNGLENLKNYLQWVIWDGLIFIHPSMASCNTSSFCKLQAQGNTLAVLWVSQFYSFYTFTLSFFYSYSYQEYLVDGENYMRVKFYVSGPKRKGTVHVDVKEVTWISSFEKQVAECWKQNCRTLASVRSYSVIGQGVTVSWQVLWRTPYHRSGFKP